MTRKTIYWGLALFGQWWALMLMVASGDSASFHTNLIKAGAPEILAKVISAIPLLAFNFWVWATAVGILGSIVFIDWKFPHIFPKKLRRMQFTSEQKDKLPIVLKNTSDVLSEIFHCPNISEKNKSAKVMLGKISKLRTTASSLPSGNLSFSILDYCKYADRVWTMGFYERKDLKKMEKLRDKIAKMITRYTD